ncbi:helix-turn-helix domain-containing protein [Streptomyces albus]|uniref:helix-turn-helix domain-containing protein n=1 Tax=Streptomyces sp. PHES57 TaxID=2872626 RepID=UPI001CECA33D|nr:helix-turn-helix domain-containing protein [Streptomyces sp. PHES57]
MIGYEPPTALPRDLLDDSELRAALGAHDFGTVFRLARSRAGISYSRIAAECDIKPARVGTLARGQGRVTSFDKIARIADALRAPGHMVGLAPRPWEVVEAPAPLTSEKNGVTVRRRTFFEAATSTGLVATLPSIAKRDDAPKRLGTADVEALRTRTARLRRLDDVLGGGDTYRVYLGEYQHTKSLLRSASYSRTTGQELVSVLAEQAQQAGWAAFDAGKGADAAGLYKESHAAAGEAGNSALLGNSLAFLAYQTIAEDKAAAVRIASRSCETNTSGTPFRVRALLHERRAWACAVAGMQNETEKALAAAREALEESSDGEWQPDWAAWVDSTELDIMSGRCWTELRRPLRAVPILEQALARYDDAHARDKALYLSWLADAYLTAGEVEQAATVAARALDLSSGVASIRPRRRLAPVLEELSRHRGLAVVGDVLERARAQAG